MADLNLKNSFLGGGTKTVRAPRLAGVKGENLADLNVGLNFFLVGKPGSGKTRTIADLILAGIKVFMVITDSGGDNGLNTIIATCLAAGKNHQYIMDHLKWKTYEIGDEVGTGKRALENDLRALRDLSVLEGFVPEVLVWEGFANYQANFIIDEFDDADGGVDNFKQWGKISTATVRDLEYFLKVPIPYKIVTCQEGQKTIKVRVGNDAKGNPIMEDRRVDTGMAALKTGAVRSVLAAFDVVMKLGIDKNGKYMYYIKSKEDGEGKTRVNLAEEMPADFMKVWDETKKQLGI